MSDDYDESFGGGFCGECGDRFHLDDCGGYNPPCPCGCGLCRSCHDAVNRSDDAEDYPPDDEGYAHA
jgi:hypothetical protein